MKVDDGFFGAGIWVGNKYTLVECPMCSGKNVFSFLGGEGHFECINCLKAGTWTDLLAYLSKVDWWVDKVNMKMKIDPIEGFVILDKYRSPSDVKRIQTGFSILDNIFEGFSEGALTVLTGKRGEGKSTFASQLALNAINYGTGVAFYSGELGASMFQNWVFTQAAGPSGVESYKERSGAIRHRATPKSEELIRKWMKNRFLLSDNEGAGASEYKTILKRFKDARHYHGARLLVVDNLMTMSYDNINENVYRRQSAFVGELVDFAQQNKCHVILVAHPKKATDEAGKQDENEMVAGSADITNRAGIVIKVERVKDEKIQIDGCNAKIKVTKNREFGTEGTMKFFYDIPTRRFKPELGTSITRYGWEDMA